MSTGTCAIGGETDESENYIAPTVITGVKPTDPLMENEVRTTFRPLRVFSVNTAARETSPPTEGSRRIVLYILAIQGMHFREQRRIGNRTHSMGSI